ncbi:hypothetical protein OJF2_37040 [Aquisphaera giovannonii]|uniref:Uncharacterized protein n=1 Tax=Aquisphaera giovannonii TaxID=406548 RepID=A0A5B9W4L6_9BACT|nr:hypothetical protein OJF2_37040 [Aquisphaera giovannonii]
MGSPTRRAGRAGGPVAGTARARPAVGHIANPPLMSRTWPVMKPAEFEAR